MISKNDRERIQGIIEAVMNVAKGELSTQVPISDNYDQIDALGMGINMMIDDLAAKEKLQNENRIIKKLNKELEAAKQKAEESERLKMAFLANMSHEIRTPMNGIIGFADILKNNVLSVEEQQEYLHIIEKSGNRMLEIINDIVDISRIESNIITLNNSEVSINEVLIHLYEFFNPEAKSKGLTLSVRKDLSDEAAIIETDPAKLNAILTNLIKNAIKYTEHGTIEMGYSMVNVDGKSTIKFFVRDTGIGIPEDEVNSVFDRFTRSKLIEDKAIEGTGLGLAISKAYVELLGGEIGVDSTVGEGTVFYFSLPFTNRKIKKGTEDLHHESEVEELEANYKILVVEDDPISAQLLQIMLKKVSSNILYAENGQEAVDLFMHNRDISLILMDISLPVMSGAEAVEQIRQIDRQVPIIAQTAYGLEGDRQKYLALGCNDYLKKPILKNELVRLVKKYCL